MNKVNVIKQNLEFIGKTWMKCIGTFASILSLFFLFWTWDDIRITSTPVNGSLYFLRLLR